jgi:pSer/pThr/pTyr-binding forkhead associated (FHA) protein
VLRIGRDWGVPPDEYEYLGVSGEHSEVYCERGVVFVTDKHSRNGTFVNGHRIPAEVAVPLKIGDLLGLGQFVQIVLKYGHE